MLFEPSMVSLPDAAKMLGIGNSTAYELVGRGEFPVTVRKVGKAYRVPRSELEAFAGISTPQPVPQPEPEAPPVADPPGRPLTATLVDETWGERLSRAYRRFRVAHGLVYEDVARRLTELGFTVSQPGVAELGDHPDIPAREATRQRAYWVLLAYGYEPADWGLVDGETVNLAAFDVEKFRWELHPSAWAEEARAERARRLK